jgi:hypothetical protein
MVPPSPNDNRFRHYMAKSKLRKAWREGLFYGVACARHRRELVEQAKTGAKISVEITIYHRQTSDDDNLTAALKPVLDGLKNLGYIFDDSPEYLRLALPVRQIESKERKTVLKIELAGDA